MTFEANSQQELSDIILKKESELSRIKQVVVRATEEEKQRERQKHNQLKCDFEHNLNLLFEKDELIKSLQRHLEDKETEYNISLRDADDKAQRVVENKIKHMRSTLEEEWRVHAQRKEEDQHRRLESEYKDKLACYHRSMNTENQNSIINALKIQEEELWTKFDKISTEKDFQYAKLEKELREIISTKRKENETIIFKIEEKWNERESELLQKIVTDCENKVQQSRQEAESTKYESENEIVQLVEEKQQLMRQINCFQNNILEVQEANTELNSKIQDLLSVIENAEKGFIKKLHDFEEEETLKCNHIISLETELKKQAIYHVETINKLKDKRSFEKRNYQRSNDVLKKELNSIRAEEKKMRISFESVRNNAKENKRLFESDTVTLTNQCSELKVNLECLQQKLNLELDTKSLLQKKNDNAIMSLKDSYSTIQQKEQMIHKLKGEMMEDRISFEKKQCRVEDERDVNMNEKEVRIQNMTELKKELIDSKLKLALTQEECLTNMTAEQDKANKLASALNHAHLENTRLKETVSEMRKEMELLTLKPQQSSEQNIQRSPFVFSDRKLEMQLNDMRSQIHQILRGDRTVERNGSQDSCELNSDDLSNIQQSLQELRLMVEGLKSENIRQINNSKANTSGKDVENKLSELSKELEVVVSERDSLLELSNKLRSDVSRLKLSIKKSNKKVERIEEKINPSESTINPSDTDELEVNALAQSLWSRVMSDKNSNMKASHRATASQKSNCLRLKDEKRKLENRCHKENRKIRNWNHKDDKEENRRDIQQP